MLKAKRIFVSARLLNSREKKKNARLVWSERVKGGEWRPSGWVSSSSEDAGKHPGKSSHRKSLGTGHMQVPWGSEETS